MGKQVLSMENVDRAIKAVATTGAARIKRVQEIGVFLICHAAQHGDYSRIAALYAALGNGERIKFAGWLSLCSPLIVDGGKVKLSRDENAPAYSPEAAVGTVWDTYKAPKREADTFTVEDLATLIAKKAKAKDATETVRSALAALQRVIDANVAEWKLAEAGEIAAMTLADPAPAELAYKARITQGAERAKHAADGKFGEGAEREGERDEAAEKDQLTRDIAAALARGAEARERMAAAA